jgi:hypothetical protein
VSQAFMRNWLVLALLCWQSLAFAADDKALFWRADIGTSSVYLFGSIHLADESFYPLRKSIYTAFEQSDALVVEVDISQQAGDINRWLQQHGYYPAGQSLATELSANTYQQLQRYLAEQGLNPERFITQRPGLLVTTLSTMKSLQYGLSPALGLDQHFISKAQQSGKPIRELETLEQQLQLLVNMPNSDLLVSKTLQQLGTMDSMMDALIANWKRGDVQKLTQLLIEDELNAHPEFQPIYQALFNDRNHAMAAKIKRMAASGGQYFVVVGSGHLLGEEGLVALLSAQGATLTRL